MGRLVLNISRWFLLICFAAALWLWGGTRPWTIDVIRWMLAADVVLFIAGLIVLRRLPRVPLIPSLTVAALLTEGWWHVWWISSRIHPQEQVGDLIPMITPFADLPLATDTMLLITGLLGAFCIACDLSANRQWLQRLWITMAAGGISIVSLGLAQKITHASAIFWNDHENTGTTFFGVYRYHANAGALMNLMLPLIWGLAFLAIRKQWNQAARAFLITSALVTFAAVFVNVSRGAAIVTVLLFLFAIIWLWILGTERARLRPWVVLIAVTSILLGVILLVLSVGIEQTLARWQFRGFFDGERYLTYRSTVEYLLPGTGCFGYGPGSFGSVFNSAIQSYGLKIGGNWVRAHNDHLQSIVEWGWIGYALWMLLLVGATFKGVRFSGHGSLLIRTLRICGSLSLIGVILHGLIDFPLQISSLQLCTALIAGMLWGADEEKIKNKSDTALTA